MRSYNLLKQRMKTQMKNGLLIKRIFCTDFLRLLHIAIRYLYLTKKATVERITREIGVGTSYVNKLINRS